MGGGINYSDFNATLNATKASVLGKVLLISNVGTDFIVQGSWTLDFTVTSKMMVMSGEEIVNESSSTAGTFIYEDGNLYYQKGGSNPANLTYTIITLI